MQRKNGYYWVFGNKCLPDNPTWQIVYWDGHTFWHDGDDFEEDTFTEIDETQIVPPNHLIKTQ